MTFDNGILKKSNTSGYASVHHTWKCHCTTLWNDSFVTDLLHHPSCCARIQQQIACATLPHLGMILGTHAAASRLRRGNTLDLGQHHWLATSILMNAVSCNTAAGPRHQHHAFVHSAQCIGTLSCWQINTS